MQNLYLVPSISALIVACVSSIALGQEEQKPAFGKEQLEVLQSLEGEWKLDEYNDDGNVMMSKREVYSNAKVAERNAVFEMVFTQTVRGRDFRVEFSIVDVDVANRQIQLAFKRDNLPPLRSWAKIDGDMMIVSTASDRNGNPKITPREFEPAVGLTLLTWSRVPNQPKPDK